MVITSIGLSIIQVGIDWAAGGKGNPQYGNRLFEHLLLYLNFYLAHSLAMRIYVNVAVLLGIVFGFTFVDDDE